MDSFSLPKLVLKRLADDWPLLASIFAGIMMATTLAAMAPVYVTALERLGLNLAIDQLARPYSNITVFASDLPLREERLIQTDSDLATAIERNIASIYDRHERFLVVQTYQAGLPGRPLPRIEEPQRLCCRAYFRSLSNLEEHVTFFDGQMGSDEIGVGPRGPLLEAVISPTTAAMFRIGVGDTLEVTPAIGAPARISVRIAGVMYATDPGEDYWVLPPSLFLDPAPPEEEEDVPGQNPGQPPMPPVPLFISRHLMAEAVGRTYPTTLIDSVWIILIDTERVKDWSLAETRRRLKDFESDLSRTMPGSSVATRLNQLLDQFERRSFFSKVPLLLLLTIMVVMVVFYLAMMVSYLVHSRSQDSALLRTRGIGTGQLRRLYLFEGLLMTAMAVAVAPFLAMGAVAAAGKVAYLRGMTGGGWLPVELGQTPFLVAGGAGLLCLAIVVIPGALGSRGGLLFQRLESGRPPATPFFQRFNLDLGLLILGGVTYWELQSRGHLVSGGLFSEPGVNETLLLAPVLFLVVVALGFMRVFPLAVRFVSGESPHLMHLAAAAAVIGLAAMLAVIGLRDGAGLGWVGRATLVLAVGGVYWTTMRARLMRARIGGLLVQAALVGGLIFMEPPEQGHALFVPTIGLMALVPTQVAFMLLRALTRTAPVWLSVGLWRMARNPLQYTWLILLLVLVTGVGILSTTVGGTLERNQEDRISYTVAADIRVANVTTLPAGGMQAQKERFLTIPGVTSASLAFRHDSSAAAVTAQLLALESDEFPYISWYRDDFSTLSLGGAMGALRSHARVERVEIPEGAVAIGLWVNPVEDLPNVTVWMVVEDGNGRMTSLALGGLGPPGWQRLTAEIPSWMTHPLRLVSVQISEPGVGSIHTPGQLLVDDIHVRVGPDLRLTVLEGFEGQMRWLPIITSTLNPDRITSTGRDSHGGRRAGVFTFGQENVSGVRGFYQSPTGGPLPVVVSTAFAESTSSGVGEVIIASVSGRSVPMVIRGTVEYFPTMEPIGGRFILADLDNLLGHVNSMSQVSSVTPNELFLKESPAAHQAVRDAVSSIFRFNPNPPKDGLGDSP